MEKSCGKRKNWKRPVKAAETRKLKKEICRKAEKAYFYCGKTPVQVDGDYAAGYNLFPLVTHNGYKA